MTTTAQRFWLYGAKSHLIDSAVSATNGPLRQLFALARARLCGAILRMRSAKRAVSVRSRVLPGVTVPSGDSRGTQAVFAPNINFRAPLSA